MKTETSEEQTCRVINQYHAQEAFKEGDYAGRASAHALLFLSGILRASTHAKDVGGEENCRMPSWFSAELTMPPSEQLCEFAKEEIKRIANKSLYAFTKVELIWDFPIYGVISAVSEVGFYSAAKRPTGYVEDAQWAVRTLDEMEIINLSRRFYASRFLGDQKGLFKNVIGGSFAGALIWLTNKALRRYSRQIEKKLGGMASNSKSAPCVS
jgi:hypothetical protein